MAGGKSHDHDDRAANILEAPHSNNDYAKDRAPSAYSYERDGQVFDRLDMLANTLDTGITSRSKQCHWLEIKDQTPTEDSESAPAPAVSTRATRPSSSQWSSNRTKKRHTLRTSISPTFNGVKSPTDRRKPPATAADVKHHARRHIRRSHNDSTTHTNPANIDSPSHLKSHRSHSFSGTVSVATSQTHNKSIPGGPNDRPQQPQSQSQTSMRPSSSDSIDTAVDDFLLAPRLNQTVQHPAEDRIIAFSDVGDPKGHVAFVCLGMGLTRYVMAFYDDLARALKLRLITPDRPGVGGSEPCDESRTAPLTWPDDIAIICNHLKITRFSLLAHSAGAIYALATALRMPQHIRGRIHLLAPWIPPSQIEMSNISIIKGNPSKSTSTDAKGPKARSLAMPYSQRLLKALPTPIFKVANAGFMSVTSASVSPNSSKFASRKKRWKNSSRSSASGGARESATPTDRANETNVCQPLQSPVSPPQIPQNMGDLPANSASTQGQHQANLESLSEDVQIALKQRSVEFDARLTNSIWELATTNANPSIDLLVCLERRQPIGFRYADVSRSVVIHHGARDTRVPLENVRWLGKTMQHCEVRVLEQEGHSLMANAVVMGNVLTEIAGECNDRTNRHSSEHTDHGSGPSTRQTVSANG
ncbi:hypothetical protein KEM56_002039 [Ascosphaera pollenicola]|nr:hypothetical protein KEM56_002039 [Ascosphaera pollenicola]